MLPAMLMLAMPVSAAISAPERNEPQGWQWYNEPQDNTEPQAPAPKQKSASELKKAYQQATQEALDNAILNSSPDNFARFMRWQNFWTERAGKFSQSAKSAMLKYPELDYNLKYSHYNGTVKEQLSMDKQKEQAAIAKLASQYGIFFFYRGQMPLDNLAGSIIANFAKDNNISIIPVSVDGVLNPALPTSRLDSGQRQRMGIKFFPAIFLVDPKQHTYRPLAYGFITPDDLSRQFLNVATGFKGEF
ncbi:TPA: type-F conjugative transfer system pilin assembly protein TraF [Aeromonas salmonicida]|nr:type-F conjugative transfer system pilin assembly protein TraF [Aeromonas salmonicida]HDN9793043.1 type-F conjugative transfer system pilin assembly protein TraF [Aeromonas salmonicida]HDN9811366.1 type-F conjugative transfer system pilin assembly protein TraF [Aeromonas salmonicida]HDN9815926.1 type-F conjugative transfer system pilin assembly protein TraF [Aeromonas salmonicida]HDO0873967.1 type-F conjugative transfer system pilin assembly protein TraF [Aeromonas salmonicida]